MRSKYEILDKNFEGISGGVDAIDYEFPSDWKMQERIENSMDEFAIEFGRYLESEMINFERWGDIPTLFKEFLESTINNHK